MTYSIFAPAFAEQIAVPAGQFNASLRAFADDLQTGLLDVAVAGLPPHTLFFARGQLVNVYNVGGQVERLEPSGWLESFNSSGFPARVRPLALTPPAVRMLKIMVEQKNERRLPAPAGCSLEAQFTTWMEHPAPALAHVVWPNAEALTFFPGMGGSPRYTLFAADDQLLHSAGSVMAIYDWQEAHRSAALLSSEPPSLAWTEYLLNHAFSRLISHLLEKFEQLTGRILINQVIRDVNFTAAAHSWNMRLNETSFIDQSILFSPESAARMYARLLQVITRHFELALGVVTLTMLLDESLAKLSPPYRAVLNQYLPILQASLV